MTVSIGRIVHYASALYSHPLAAIVTYVHRDNLTVDLCVFTREGSEVRRNVPFAQMDGVEGTWTWPPRV